MGARVQTQELVSEGGSNPHPNPNPLTPKPKPKPNPSPNLSPSPNPNQVSEGGSGEWFAGTVLALHPDGHATVVYDDGAEWTGALSRIYLLQGADEESPLPNPPLAPRGAAGTPGSVAIASEVHPEVEMRPMGGAPVQTPAVVGIRVL